MSNIYTIKGEILTGIAEAIREKNGSEDSYKPGDMAAAIRQIKAGDAVLNIAYGDTAPEDTSKLWVKTAEPVGVQVNTKVTGNEKLETFVSALPEWSDSMGTAAVGNKVYLFGGFDAAADRMSTIRVFDVESQTISTLDTTLPTAISSIAAAAVGNKVYLFGGDDGSARKTIHVFDTESESITTLDTELNQAAYHVAAAAVGTKVYLFGGAYSSSYRYATIHVFDTDSNTISKLSASLPSATMTAVAAIGTDIYVFGGPGLKTIHVFDTKTNTLSLLSTTLPKALSYLPAVAVGTKAYLFGGVGGGSAIYVFDAENETVTCLDDTLPTATSSIGATAVGNKIYLFGGDATGGRSPAIHVFVVAMPLEENVMLIETSQMKNMWKLYIGESVKIACGVANVYLGNSEGIAEKVAAAVYENESWVDI